MFKLDRISKAYGEAGSFNEQVNLFGFIDDQVFLTKGDDVGIVLAVEGVDYECLDSAAVDHFTKRLESAFKIFDEKCRVYQYLFKRKTGRRFPTRLTGILLWIRLLITGPHRDRLLIIGRLLVIVLPLFPFVAHPSVNELTAFGLALRTLRQRAQLTQEQLADLCGLHRTYIGSLERGERNVGLLNIHALARALNISPAEMLRTAEKFRQQPAKKGS